MLRMGDAVNPAGLPAGLDAYAGYDAGNWPDFWTIATQHPGTHLIEITPFCQNKGDMLDIEYGDAQPVQGPLWTIARTLAGVWRPVLYCSRDDAPIVVGFMNNGGINRGSYRLITAHYGAGQHICGPRTCGLSVQADATQWIDWGAWDETTLPDDFFAPAGPPPAPVALPPVIVPPGHGAASKIHGQENLMVVDFHLTTGLDGTGYVTIPIPAGCSRMVAASIDVADPLSFTPSHHDVDVDQVDPAGPRDASGVVAQPVVPPKNGAQEVRVVGEAASKFLTGHAIFA